jgi:SOS-response transcriptional repressor LexA
MSDPIAVELLKHLELWRELHAVSKTELASIIGLKSKQTYTNWIRRGELPKNQIEAALAIINSDTPEQARRVAKRSGRSSDDWAKMSSMLNVTRDRAEARKNGNAPTAESNRPASRNLPLISSVAAGAWSEAVDPYEPGDAEEWVSVPGTWSKHAFILKVEGDSMTSASGGVSIPHGAMVAVEPEADHRNGSIVVARLDGQDAATVKKLVIDGPITYLMPLNERYKPIEVNSNCRIVGVVKKVMIDVF